MNIKGFKNLIRTIDKQINLKLWNEQMHVVFEGNIENFLEDNRFDMLKFRWFNCSFKNNSPLNFVINAGTEDMISLSNDITVKELVDSFLGVRGYVSYKKWSNQNYVYNISHHENPRALRDEETENLFVDFIELNFYKRMFDEIIKEDSLDKIEKTKLYDDLLSVLLVPIQPKWII